MVLGFYYLEQEQPLSCIPRANHVFLEKTIFSCISGAVSIFLEQTICY